MTDTPPSAKVDALNAVIVRLRRYEQRSADADGARSELHAAIRKAREAGVRQVDLTACTGYTREHIRRVCHG